MDPLAEKYPNFSPYAYTFNNPIRFVDPTGLEGTSTGVRQNKNGTYTVVSAKDDGNTGIYLADANGNYDVNTSYRVANSLTPRSFMGDNNKAVVGAVINPKDMSGNNFLNDLMGANEPSIFYYIFNATGGKKYDFKTNGPNGEVNWAKKNVSDDKRVQYFYRGVLFSIDNNTDNVPVIASGRDIGNFGAGYIAGNNGLTWETTRLGFDFLESIQQRGSTTEGQTSQQAQRAGYNVGSQRYINRYVEFYKLQSSNPLQNIINIDYGKSYHIDYKKNIKGFNHNDSNYRIIICLV